MSETPELSAVAVASLDDALAQTCAALCQRINEEDSGVGTSRFAVFVQLANGAVHAAEGEYLGKVGRG